MRIHEFINPLNENGGEKKSVWPVMVLCWRWRWTQTQKINLNRNLTMSMTSWCSSKFDILPFSSYPRKHYLCQQRECHDYWNLCDSVGILVVWFFPKQFWDTGIAYRSVSISACQMQVKLLIFLILLNVIFVFFHATAKNSFNGELF